MTIQRGILKRRNQNSGVSAYEFIADVQYFAEPGQGKELQQGRVLLSIKDAKSFNGNNIPDGDYDFQPVTPGLFTEATVLPLRKSGDNWHWRSK